MFKFLLVFVVLFASVYCQAQTFVCSVSRSPVQVTVYFSRSPVYVRPVPVCPPPVLYSVPMYRVPVYCQPPVYYNPRPMPQAPRGSLFRPSPHRGR